jgi:hypothetical protein
MSFLNPLLIAVAAGLTIPPLVALYFLKLKRAARVVPSTLLWKRAVEDLHVNSPFQRLRSSLLLLLQLLVLIAAAVALGKPMLQTAKTHESTIVILIDQSASMGIVEADGRSRLEQAKEQAKLYVDNMSNEARAMVIAFCDRATVASPFDSDKRALKQRIDAVEQTQSTSSLGEAMSLAEAYTQNMVIGRKDGPDIEVKSQAPPATVVLFTDGRIEDADRVALQKLDVDKMRVINVGRRGDNVGIMSMDARRHYERPEILEVAAAIRNFGPEPVAVDAVLYVEGQNVDVQTVQLAGAKDVDGKEEGGDAEPALDATSVAVFDDIEFAGGGIVEVVLRVDDALPADDRAWTIIEKPRHIRVLLVTNGNLFFDNVLSVLPLEAVTMTPEEYESADDEDLTDGERSVFDVVILDGHSTARLPQGNYFFWGAVPEIEGVSTSGVIDDQVIFNWDDTHPVLRHVAVETIFVYEWLALSLPPEAISIIDGETSPVMSYFTRNASQFIISAFRVIIEDDDGHTLMNTYWVTNVDFVVFMQNVIQYLSANVATRGKKSVSPGEPVTLPIPQEVEQVRVARPDKKEDRVPSAGYQTIHYADTRLVGTYRIEPGVPGQDAFAVNLFNAVESRVEPAETLTIGADSVEAQAATVEVNVPAWHYFLIGMLVLLLVEWVVYNQRVFV